MDDPLSLKKFERRGCLHLFLLMKFIPIRVLTGSLFYKQSIIGYTFNAMFRKAVFDLFTKKSVLIPGKRTDLFYENKSPFTGRSKVFNVS